jgi:2-succinyl-6-hydroxy-2,4-cyclohexadiene-1-carboxylate synthase
MALTHTYPLPEEIYFTFIRKTCIYKHLTTTLERISVETSGKKPQLLFIHGFLGTGGDWDRVRGKLDAGYQSGTIDLDQWAPSDEYSLEFIAEQIAQSLDESDSGTIIVAYSMGARIALSLALRFPKNIKALVLESPSAGIENAEQRVARAKKDAELAQAIRSDGLESFLARWYSIPLFDSLRSYPLLLKSLKERILFTQEDEQAAYMLEKLSPGLAPNYWPELSRIKIPSLLIAGSLDSKFSDSAQKMSELMPNASVSIIPGSGHNIHLEKPDDFLETILPFVIAQSE